MLSPMAYKQNIPGQVMPSSVKNPPAVDGDMGSVSGSGRALGEGNGNPLQYFCPENPMDGGAWQATVHGLPRVGHDLVTKQQWKITKPYTMAELQAKRKLGPESHLSNRSAHLDCSVNEK